MITWIASVTAELATFAGNTIPYPGRFGIAGTVAELERCHNAWLAEYCFMQAKH